MCVEIEQHRQEVRKRVSDMASITLNNQQASRKL